MDQCLYTLVADDGRLVAGDLLGRVPDSARAEQGFTLHRPLAADAHRVVLVVHPGFP